MKVKRESEVAQSCLTLSDPMGTTRSQRNPIVCSQSVSGVSEVLFHGSLVKFFERGREKLQAGTGRKSNFTSDSTLCSPMTAFDMK